MNARRPLHPAVLAVAGVVAAAAFAFSADSWVQLAEIAGFDTSWKIGPRRVYLSWLMPLAYDAYTALATWSYFTARHPGFRRYAAVNALGSAALSIVVQGAYHGLKANEVDVASKWGLVVAVGAIPAALLAAVVHLIAEYLRDRRAPTQPELARTSIAATDPAPVLAWLARPVDLRASTASAPRRATWVDRAGRATLPIVARHPAPLAIPTIVIPAPLARATDSAPPAPPRHEDALLARHLEPAPPRANGRATAVLARPAAPPAPRATRTKPPRATATGPRPDVLARRAAIREYLAKHPGSGSRVISDALNIPDRTVTRDLQAIKEES